MALHGHTKKQRKAIRSKAGKSKVKGRGRKQRKKT